MGSIEKREFVVINLHQQKEAICPSVKSGIPSKVNGI